MYSYSDFKYKGTSFCDVFEVPMSDAYKVELCGKEIPVYSCRISAYPFNTWWPGHQRPVNQTDLVSYINLVSDEEITLTVEPLKSKDYKKVMLKPYSKNVRTKEKDGKITFTLKENGAYVLELDDYHGLLYIFNNKPVPCENPDGVTYYFGPGVHFAERITLKSNESIYVHKDALVYGCVFARDAENIKVYGNGVFDDSWEERHNQHCYVPFTNGNVKLYDCKNIVMQGVGYTNSALWCVNLFHCFDVEIDGINVFGQWRYNTDGIDMMNSQRIVIRNSFVHSFDDTIVVKGIDKYSFDNCQDILTENCVLWCDWGKTCEIGLETAAPEYKNITFRNCDVLRGGNSTCDIQNGDWANVHDIVFDDIRIELESFYTPSVYQATQEQKYEWNGEVEISRFLCISNHRFRDAYAFIEFGKGDEPEKNELYAAIHDITVKNIRIYCDEDVLSRYGKGCARVRVCKKLESAKYENITVENICLNGKKLSADDMDIDLEAVPPEVLTIK
ncbi:MAG: hypothetical protein IKU43_10370 [Clostridia bacterium]|nr:hypothetical protein [Clostridia bacterium]